MLATYKEESLYLAPFWDRKTTVKRVEFFTPFDRKLLSDFNDIKNFLRGCSNSGEIVRNARLLPLRDSRILWSYLSLFRDARGGVIFPYRDQSAL